MPEPAPTVRPSLPRWVWVVGAAAYAPVLALLVILALQVEDTRTTVDGRLATAVGRLERATLPLADEVTPAARAANADRPAAKRLTTTSLALAAQLAPVVRELGDARPGRQLGLVGALASDLSDRGAGTQLQKAGALSDNLLRVDAGREIRRSGTLATTLLGAGVGDAVGDVRALTDAVRDADLPATAGSLTRVTDELGRGTRLERLMVRLTALLGQAQTLGVVPSVDAASDAVTGRLLPLVERGIAMLATTMELTRDTNGHAASLDRKLGGELPAPAARSGTRATP